MKQFLPVMLSIVLVLTAGTALAQRAYVYTTETPNGGTLDVDLYLQNTSTPFVLGTSSFVIQYDPALIASPQVVSANDGPWSSSDADYWALSSIDHPGSGYADLLVFFNGGADNTGTMVTAVPTRVGTLRFTILNPAVAAQKTWRAIAIVTQLTALANPGVDITYREITDSCAFHVVDLKALLQGPYASGGMATSLRTAGLVPGVQPYSVPPWSYSGTESAAVLPADVVDWVLVELRSDTAGATKVASQAALLKSNGSIIGDDGSPLLGFRGINAGQYHVVLRHRNHLSVMSAGTVTLSATSALYDFTTGLDKYYGGDAKMLATGVYGMWSGDVTGNGIMKYSGSLNDRAPILTRIGGPADMTLVVNGYYNEDVNMNGQVKYSGIGSDRAFILSNIGADMTATKSTKVPN